MWRSSRSSRKFTNPRESSPEWRPNSGVASDNYNNVLLPRKLILQLNVNRNVSLGSGYRAYPGYSAAQVRQQFGVGW